MVIDAVAALGGCRVADLHACIRSEPSRWDSTLQTQFGNNCMRIGAYTGGPTVLIAEDL